MLLPIDTIQTDRVSFSYVFSDAFESLLPEFWRSQGGAQIRRAIYTPVGVSLNISK